MSETGNTAGCKRRTTALEIGTGAGGNVAASQSPGADHCWSPLCVWGPGRGCPQLCPGAGLCLQEGWMARVGSPGNRL